VVKADGPECSESGPICDPDQTANSTLRRAFRAAYSIIIVQKERSD